MRQDRFVPYSERHCQGSPGDDDVASGTAVRSALSAEGNETTIATMQAALKSYGKAIKNR